MLVWKAISSMVLTIFATLALARCRSVMAVDICCMSAAPVSAARRVSAARVLAESAN